MMRLPQYAVGACCAMACFLAAMVAAAEVRVDFPNHDDFHYPPEERSEYLDMKAQMPTLQAINATTATLAFPSGEVVSARAPSMIKDDWHVVAILATAAPVVVLEREFNRWGYMAVLGLSSSVTIRKSVGALAGIEQPFFNFSGVDPDYFQKVSTGLTDYAATLAEGAAADGEANFTGLANTLAPQRDIVSISNKQDVVKFAVTHAGRVKCAYREDTPGLTEGGITELTNQHSPAPNPQTIVFDPADHLDFWPERFEGTKTGMLGGWLSMANVGSFSRTQNKGFELIAFGPNKPPATPVASPPCAYTAAINNTYLAGYPAGGSRAFSTLAAAETACDQTKDCNGITLSRTHKYEPRAGAVALPSPYGETSWLMTNASKAVCRTLPRLPGIVYNPGVYVRLRAQSGATWGAEDKIQYFYVDNSTLASGSGPRTVSEVEFYTALADKAGAQRTRMSGGMTVSLPGSEGQRQLDMSLAGMLGASNNYIGDQSNYGYGGTYWSYGREDNGSLPLNVLTVDSAMLEWGLFNESAAHLGFYFDNYARADGSIDYYSWGGRGDSVGDTGRLIDIYADLMRVGNVMDPQGAAQFASRYFPVIESFGRYLLRLIAKQAKVSPPAGAAGLLQGAPEHDWFSTQDKYFYNNNVWTLRGLDVLADLVAARPGGGNKTFIAELQAAAQSLRSAIAQSVEECKVTDGTGKVTFLPPYAQKGMTPYKSMTDSREASYSNFRFWSETLLADVLPRDTEAAWLDYHNNKGGRVGGASRWSSHLDDMPVAGWGYSALAHNRTQDFNALLYGHMATYQSRGSFHATEQLSFQGEGLYRSFLHWKDPLPSPTGESSPVAADAAGELGGYYSQEQDVSFCIVTEVLAARLTRWQLVFEDFYRPTYGSGKSAEAPAVWLGRGAPLRWFAPAEGGHKAGFNVTCAPTRVGCVSFNATVQGPTQATYSVRIHNVPAGAPQGVVFKLRWPAKVASPKVTGAKVVAVDDGVVAVLPGPDGVFSVSTSYTR